MCSRLHAALRNRAKEGGSRGVRLRSESHAGTELPRACKIRQFWHFRPDNFQAQAVLVGFLAAAASKMTGR